MEYQSKVDPAKFQWHFRPFFFLWNLSSGNWRSEELFPKCFENYLSESFVFISVVLLIVAFLNLFYRSWKKKSYDQQSKMLLLMEFIGFGMEQYNSCLCLNKKALYSWMQMSVPVRILPQCCQITTWACQRLPATFTFNKRFIFFYLNKNRNT